MKTMEKPVQLYMILFKSPGIDVCRRCPYYRQQKPAQTSYCSATHDFTGPIQKDAKCKEENLW